MNKYLYLIVLLGLTACGNSAVNVQMVGQPKQVFHNTPLVCPNYNSVDISLGVMVNGVGSMSSHDEVMSFEVENEAANLAVLEEAIKGGKLVNITYNDRRFVVCKDEERVVKVELMETSK